MSIDMYPAESGFTAQLPVPQQDPLRPLRIAANLLPDEVQSGRRARRTRAVAVTGVGAVVLALAGWYATTVVKAQDAQDELVRAEAQAAAVQQDQREYSELTGVKSELNTAKERLGALMANDSQWQQLIADIRAAAPRDVSIVQLGAGISNQDLTGQTGETGLPSEVTDKLVGTITLGGTAKDKDQVADFVDNLREVTGLANPLPVTITTSDGSENFTIEIDITQAALGGRFTPEATETPVPGSTTGGN
ncbi:PilN domain-containing protein [Catenuloplanes atrovinosus]|uniref:Tfp pilus assembly protein PilN n=1 Tax=Catenuloplanes atrovinosus TaxID=137266 RepID=A0AAE3YIV0_9ACTN|nr:PilN domain-containing protein [Catenuloplanes atrovinosus]MDR7274628.1 Tfp pilus assembly protein PilN [Catenuloplanes atrovinosus]